jgi:acetyltransferase-like isoleucine patch superfamily enzyme
VDRPRRLAGAAALGAYRVGQKVGAHAFTAACSGAFESMGSRSVIQPPVRIEGERRISIGSRVYVGQGSWLHVEDGPGGPGHIEVGDDCGLTGLCVLSSACSLRLGSSVLLARNVYVADHRHAFSDPERPVLDQGVEQVAPVDIADGAWLGQNVVVGPGVSIGAGAVIGANSVVLADVPAFAVAVGAPARVVRRVAEPAQPAS